MEAAEDLFAREGIEGVSLRRIGVAAGAGNHFAVQYHFGDKSKLVRAIFERRLPSLDVRRARWLAEAKRQGRLDDPHALMEVSLRPLAEEVDAGGRRTYAAFLLNLHYHGAGAVRLDASDLAPISSHVADLLLAANQLVPRGLSYTRMESSVVLFLDALADLDRRKARDKITAEAEAAILNDAINMASAAFTVPPVDVACPNRKFLSF